MEARQRREALAAREPASEGRGRAAWGREEEADIMEVAEVEEEDEEK